MPWSYIKFSQLILKGNVWRPVWRICMLILGLKGLMLKESIYRFVICFVIANPRNLRSVTNSGRSCEGPLTRAYKKSQHTTLKLWERSQPSIGNVCLQEWKNAEWGHRLRELSLLSWIFPKKCIQKLTIASSILRYS